VQKKKKKKKHGDWLKNLFKRIINNNVLMKIKADNKVCIAIAENENAKGRSKHSNIRYKYIQEKIKEKNIKLKYVKTTDMHPNPLKRPISSINIKKFNNIIIDDYN